MTVQSATTRERRRLYRWVAAVGLLAAAEEQRGSDVPETNAMGLLAAHAACEAMLGLIVGVVPYSKGKPTDPYFPELLELAASRAKPRIDIGLKGDLMLMHRTRNGFVHAGQTIDAAELDRAIESAHSLAEHVPLPGSDRLVGTGTVVADVIDIEAIGMWFRHADRMRREGHLRLAADGIARALDAALDRTVPRVRHRRKGLVARDLDKMLAIPGGRGLDSDLRTNSSAIGDLANWVYPMALGTSPATLSYVRSVVGKEAGVDVGGGPQPVTRPSKEDPPEREYRRASSIVAHLVLRLWAIGSLAANESDPQIVAMAEGFLANPSGLAASGYGSG